MKYILHIDMNAFFASVEEVLNPSLANKPIAVSGKTSRSVISSANYIAREKGVKAAMPVFMAKKKCKNLVVVLHHFDEYEKYSHKFMNLIRQKVTNLIQPLSIDECYADITSLVSSSADAVKLAKKIQDMIYNQLGLKSSIGVSYNLFLAKMASDMKKPMGITSIFTKNDIETKLWPLDINDMYLIGQSSAKILKEHKIYTIKDIADKKNKKTLSSILNKNWYIHYLHANGIGSDELDYSRALPKSLSNSQTFLLNTNNPIEIKEKMMELTHELVERLKYYNLSAKTIQVIVKYPDFHSVTKHLTLKTYVNEFADIFNTAWNIFNDNYLYQDIRLIGVGLINLKEIVNLNSELFDTYVSNKEAKVNDIEKIIKKVNKDMNLDILSLASKKLK